MGRVCDKYLQNEAFNTSNGNCYDVMVMELEI
jgi:hypothetical protein